MADILIRDTSISNLIGKVIEIGYDAADCLYAFVNNGEDDILEAVELPPHGDLIDLDATIEESKKPTIFDLTDVPDFLYEQPVIITADKEENNI